MSYCASEVTFSLMKHPLKNKHCWRYMRGFSSRAWICAIDEAKTLDTDDTWKHATQEYAKLQLSTVWDDVETAPVSSYCAANIICWNTITRYWCAPVVQLVSGCYLAVIRHQPAVCLWEFSLHEGHEILTQFCILVGIFKLNQYEKNIWICCTTFNHKRSEVCT